MLHALTQVVHAQPAVSGAAVVLKALHMVLFGSRRYILKVQVGDKRWFKGVDKDAKVQWCPLSCDV
jgi:hypothetical protein